MTGTTSGASGFGWPTTSINDPVRMLVQR
jgi:hypothetical protein